MTPVDVQSHVACVSGNGQGEPAWPSLDDPRVACAMEDYMAALDAGKKPDRQDFLAEHGDIAAALEQCLGGLEFMHTAGSQLQSPGPEEASPRAGQIHPEGPLGDFRIVREAGRGGMGVVYEAVQISLGRRVALKVLPFAAALDARQLQRFKNEAQAAACLHHTNIVPVYTVGCKRGVHYFAMQFIEGQSLDAVLAQLRQDQKLAVDNKNHEAARDEPSSTAVGLPAPAPRETVQDLRGQASTLPSRRQPREYHRRVVELTVQAAEALEHAHELGVIHRDIKPANLLLDARGKLWITDFGLAQIQSDTRLTLTGDLVGTLRYMSPEQALAKRVIVDHRTDIYSLGATLYELLTLAPVFSGQDRQELLRQIAFEEPAAPRKLNRTIPAELETVLLKAVEKNPADRYGTAKEMADDLKRFLNDEPTLARRPTAWQRARKWARRHAAAVRATAVACVVILAALTGMAGWWLREQDARKTELAGQQDSTERAVNALLKDAVQLQTERRIPDALAKVKQAKATLDSGASTARQRQQVQRRVADLQMVADLEQLRDDPTLFKDEGGFDIAKLDGQYFRVFQASGLDLAALPPGGAGRRIQEGTVAVELAAVLDDWYSSAKRLKNEERCKRLLAVARAADTDALRTKLRQVLERNDVKALKVLLTTNRASELPPATVVAFARALQANGSIGDAVELLQQAQRRHSSDFWINYELAWMLEEQEFPDFYGLSPVVRKSLRNIDIVRFSSIACALRPENRAASLHLGTALARAGQLDEAMAIYRKMFLVKNNSAMAHFQIGRALVAKRLPDLAIAEYRVVLQIADPKSSIAGNAQINICLALESKGLVDEAIAEYKAALRRDPGDKAFRINLGLILRETGRLDEAIEVFREGALLWPGDAAMRLDLGVALKERKGSPQEAIRVFRDIIQRNPKSVGGHNQLAWLLVSAEDLKLRDAKEALKHAEKAVELAPKSVECLNTLGVAQFRNGKWQEAVDTLTSVQKVRTGNLGDTYHFLAMAHWQLGNMVEARSCLEKAQQWLEKNQAKLSVSLKRELELQRAEVAELMGIELPKLKGKD